MVCCDFTLMTGAESPRTVYETMRDLCSSVGTSAYWDDDSDHWINYPPRRVDTVAQDPVQYVTSADWRDRVMVAVAGEPEVLRRLAENELSLPVVSALASNPHCPADAFSRIIDIATEDSDCLDELLCLVADHPNIDRETAERLIDVGKRHPNHQYRWEFLQVLVANPVVPEDILEATVVAFPDLVGSLRRNPATADSRRLSLLCNLVEGDPKYRHQPELLTADLDALLTP